MLPDTSISISFAHSLTQNAPFSLNNSRLIDRRARRPTYEADCVLITRLHAAQTRGLRVSGRHVALLAYATCQRNASVLNPRSDLNSSSVSYAFKSGNSTPGLHQSSGGNVPSHALVTACCVAADRLNESASCRDHRSRDLRSSRALSLLLGLPLTCLLPPPLCFSAGLPALVVAVSVGFTRARGYGTAS